jgi:hypothetical protein
MILYSTINSPINDSDEYKTVLSGFDFLIRYRTFSIKIVNNKVPQNTPTNVIIPQMKAGMNGILLSNR